MTAKLARPQRLARAEIVDRYEEPERVDQHAPVARRELPSGVEQQRGNACVIGCCAEATSSSNSVPAEGRLGCSPLSTEEPVSASMSRPSRSSCSSRSSPASPSRWPASPAATPRLPASSATTTVGRPRPSSPVRTALASSPWPVIHTTATRQGAPDTAFAWGAGPAAGRRRRLGRHPRARSPWPPRRWRGAELVAALSLATDLGMGFPFDHGLETTLIAMRLGDRLGIDRATASHTYYACLLSHVGCTTDAHVAAEIFGGSLTTRSIPSCMGRSVRRSSGCRGRCRSPIVRRPSAPSRSRAGCRGWPGCNKSRSRRPARWRGCSPASGRRRRAASCATPAE